MRTLREQLVLIRAWETQPTFYLTIMCLGLAEAIEHGIQAAKFRAGTLPKFLDQAGKNLISMPACFRDMGLEMVEDARAYLVMLKDKLPLLSDSLDALDRFETRLKAASSRPGFRIPQDELALVVEQHINCGTPVTEVDDLLDHEIDAMNRVLARAADEMGCDTWREAYAAIPPPKTGEDGLVGLYRDVVLGLGRHCRSTTGPDGEFIPDLVEWTRQNWDNLVLKPERGYSGKGVCVGGVHKGGDKAISLALEKGAYIVQKKVGLYLWAEDIPELNAANNKIVMTTFQTDFRCLFSNERMLGFLCRYGKVPTNVGSGGGVQPMAVLKSDPSVREATDRMNASIMKMDYAHVAEAVQLQNELAMQNRFTYLLGPIKMALRPRLITQAQIEHLETYCRGIWEDCLTLESMWAKGGLDHIIDIEPEELDIARSQPWRGSPAIFASDGIFSFGAHKQP